MQVTAQNTRLMHRAKATPFPQATEAASHPHMTRYQEPWMRAATFSGVHRWKITDFGENAAGDGTPRCERSQTACSEEQTFPGGVPVSQNSAESVILQRHTTVLSVL